jgi:hypothetical protein
VPGVLETVTREFDPRNGYSLSTLAREALGLP